MSGYFEQKRTSPASFATVVLLHVAVLGAVVLIKGPAMIERSRPIHIITIPPERMPPEEPPPPRPDEPVTRPTTTTTVVTLPRDPPPLPPLPYDPPRIPTIDVGPIVPPDPPPAHNPVRRGAEIDPRFASALQPPYPASEQRAGREGTVQMRVTIGPDGRVRSVERISATSDDFWRAAERQAMTRWRFRPATLDGRPVESTKFMSLRFVLEGLA